MNLRDDILKAVHDWIRDDAPLNVKMTVTPEQVALLVDRIVQVTGKM